MQYLLLQNEPTKWCSKPALVNLLHRINGVIEAKMRRKTNKLKRPKGLSCRPVLIHINGAQNSVVATDYFAEIIDFSKILDDDQSAVKSMRDLHKVKKISAKTIKEWITVGRR